MAATVTDRVASRLESVTSSIGNKNFDEMIGEVETVARRSPAAFLGAAAALGFIASRFLKSSSPRQRYSFDSATDFERNYSAEFGSNPSFGSTGFNRGSGVGDV